MRDSFHNDVLLIPHVLRRIIEHYSGKGRQSLIEAKSLFLRSNGAPVFTGMGASYFSSMAARVSLASYGHAVELWEAGELLHYHLGIFNAGRLVVVTSQSGESVEVLRLIEEVGAQCPVVAITGNPDSTLSRRARVALPLLTDEKSGIATQTFTNSLAVMHLLASEIAGIGLDAELVRLEAVAAATDRLLASGKMAVEEAVKFLDDARFLYFISRGPSQAVSRQGALMFIEGARLPTCAMPGGTFRHGPFEMAGEGFYSVFFAPEGRTFDITTGLALEIAGMGGHVLLITDSDISARRHNLMVIRLPRLGEDLFPIMAFTHLALVLELIARYRGYEPGVFEHISKVTRRE